MNSKLNMPVVFWTSLSRKAWELLQKLQWKPILRIFLKRKIGETMESLQLLKTKECAVHAGLLQQVISISTYFLRWLRHYKDTLNWIAVIHYIFGFSRNSWELLSFGIWWTSYWIVPTTNRIMHSKPIEMRWYWRLLRIYSWNWILLLCFIRNRNVGLIPWCISIKT